MRAKHHLLEMLPLVGPSRLSCRSVRCNRRLVEHGRGPRWWKPRAGHSTWCWVMLSSIKGVFFQKCMGLYPGSPNNAPPQIWRSSCPQSSMTLLGSTTAIWCYPGPNKRRCANMSLKDTRGHGLKGVQSRCSDDSKSEEIGSWWFANMWAQHSTSWIC